MFKITSIKKILGSKMLNLPSHLKKYIVEQDYQNYTAQDHAVWRYIMRQLKQYLSVHAHHSYLDGLTKTGISIDRIPKIEEISSHLEKFGWRALPVSGFIPPAAFMELQSLSILPIAADMRSIDHLLYTPAPDIVHEAAGHAPILADPDYAAYLKKYAQVAQKAIISKEDIDLYKAIRELSDIKENPSSSPTQIAAAEKKLIDVSKSMSFVSEAAELSRMNWWTAEYGLIGDLNSPKIFGAGLLSSVGESKWCLSEAVKKIPLTINCIQQSYDITEPQPQLFVAKNFEHLGEVLEEFSETMSYRIGGIHGLHKAMQAHTINTVQFENGLQISGELRKFSLDKNKEISYLQFNGPTQISYQDVQVAGHGKTYHSHGYGTPMGTILNPEELLKLNQNIILRYSSGVEVEGILVQKNSLGANADIYTFDRATCRYNSQILFQPEWGPYDILTGHKVTSVFGGPADRNAYGDVEDFVAARVQKNIYSPSEYQKFEIYQKIRDLRESQNISTQSLLALFEETLSVTTADWLLYLELFELALLSKAGDQSLLQKIKTHLEVIGQGNSRVQSQITDGLNLIYAQN